MARDFDLRKEVLRERIKGTPKFQTIQEFQRTIKDDAGVPPNEFIDAGGAIGGQHPSRQESFIREIQDRWQRGKATPKKLAEAIDWTVTPESNVRILTERGRISEPEEDKIQRLIEAEEGGDFLDRQLQQLQDRLNSLARVLKASTLRDIAEGNLSLIDAPDVVQAEELNEEIESAKEAFGEGQVEGMIEAAIVRAAEPAVGVETSEIGDDEGAVVGNDDRNLREILFTNYGREAYSDNVLGTRRRTVEHLAELATGEREGEMEREKALRTTGKYVTDEDDLDELTSALRAITTDNVDLSPIREGFEENQRNKSLTSGITYDAELKRKRQRYASQQDYDLIVSNPEVVNLSDIPGIGRRTEEKIREIDGFGTGNANRVYVAAADAFDGDSEAISKLKEVGGVLPSREAADNLIEAVKQIADVFANVRKERWAQSEADKRRNDEVYPDNPNNIDLTPIMQGFEGEPEDAMDKFMQELRR